MKHGLIKDAAYYEWTIEHMSDIREREVSTLKRMISAAVRSKRAVVEKDPMEKGGRGPC